MNHIFLFRVMTKSIGGLHCVCNNLTTTVLYSNILKSIALLALDLSTKWNLNILMLVVAEKTIYQAQSLKQSYSQTKTKTSHLLSLNRDPSVTILSVTV